MENNNNNSLYKCAHSLSKVTTAVRNLPISKNNNKLSSKATKTLHIAILEAERTK